MNLKDLTEKLSIDAVFLVHNNGTISDAAYTNEEDKVNENNIAAFLHVAINMANDFFNTVLNANGIDEFSLKSGSKVFYALKCDTEHMLCVISSDLVNAKLLSLTIKKEFNLK